MEPPATGWVFDPTRRCGEDLVAVGGDLQPGTLLEAYRTGVFPMGIGPHGHPPLAWWSPDPRGVLLPGGLKVSRSLRKSLRRFEFSVDADFKAVVAGCADPSRDGRWITATLMDAYLELHRLGWAHSVEVWAGADLVGGLYGVSISGLFAGESMFHRVTDASKVALVALNDILFIDHDPRRIIDVQWNTSHLASLGVTEVPQADYLRRLRAAVEAPQPAWPTAGQRDALRNTRTSQQSER
nr:leucyl/phenylalanyl-tRNA--protein transferase [Gephyromycinifex aptenodytis]